MYKLTGALLIMICFIMFGLGKCITIKRRLKYLKEFRAMIDALRAEISFSATPLTSAAEKIGTKFSNECFKDFARLISERGGQDAFEMAVTKYADKYAFTARDQSCILLMANGLGRTNRENQVRQLDYTLMELEKVIGEASGECMQKTRSYINGSVLIGAFAVLMLM